MSYFHSLFSFSAGPFEAQQRSSEENATRHRLIVGSPLIHRSPANCLDVAAVRWQKTDKSTSVRSLPSSQHKELTAACFAAALFWKSELNNDPISPPQQTPGERTWLRIYMCILCINLAAKPRWNHHQTPFLKKKNPAINQASVHFLFLERKKKIPSERCHGSQRHDRQMDRMNHSSLMCWGHLAASLTEFEGSLEGIDICPLRRTCMAVCYTMKQHWS